MSTIIIVYGSIEGQTRKICETVARKVEVLGHHPVLVDASEKNTDTAGPKAEALIVGAPIHEYRYPAAVRRYLKAHRETLSGLPSLFLSVSLAALSDEESELNDLKRLSRSFAESADWKPTEIHQIAGALKYTEYNFFKRFILKQIMRSAGGPLDTAQDYEFTDWAALDDIVGRFVSNNLDASTAG